jgi:hypothetical protein
MKNTDTMENDRPKAEDELLAEYAFDYSKARPNRFARDIAQGSLIVVLEPELARVFKTSDRVNAILRAIADTMPQSEAEAVSG